MRLHLGSGQYHWPGFKNLDEETNLKNLSQYYKVDEIHCIHLFEHLPRLEIDQYLQEWHATLKDGGYLIMELPSLDKIAQMIVDGEKNPRLTLMGIFGDPRDRKERPLMRHEWAWTEHELRSVLEANGFEVEFQPPARPRLPDHSAPHLEAQKESK